MQTCRHALWRRRRRSTTSHRQTGSGSASGIARSNRSVVSPSTSRSPQRKLDMIAAPDNGAALLSKFTPLASSLLGKKEDDVPQAAGRRNKNHSSVHLCRNGGARESFCPHFRGVSRKVDHGVIGGGGITVISKVIGEEPSLSPKVHAAGVVVLMSMVADRSYVELRFPRQARVQWRTTRRGWWPLGLA